MNTPHICQAVHSGLDELAELFNKYRDFRGQTGDLPAARHFLKARFGHGESVIFIAHVNATPSEFPQLYPSWLSTALARVFVLNDLFVHPRGRSPCVASGPLAAAERQAWSEGAVRVSLKVAQGNAPGRALYAARGWIRDDQVRAYHRLP